MVWSMCCAGLAPTAGQAAIAHRAVRKVVFVGSPETGRRVAMAAAAALKPVVLELGGKSANIVFEDANLEHACLGAQAAIFFGRRTKLCRGGAVTGSQVDP